MSKSNRFEYNWRALQYNFTGVQLVNKTQITLTTSKYLLGTFTWYLWLSLPGALDLHQVLLVFSDVCAVTWCSGGLVQPGGLATPLI